MNIIGTTRFLTANPSQVGLVKSGYSLAPSKAHGGLSGEIVHQTRQLSHLREPRETSGHIQKATRADTAKIVSLYARLDQPSWENRFNGPKAETNFEEAMTRLVNASPHQLTYFEGDRLIGVVEIGIRPPSKACDLGIAVEGDARGRSVGKKLIRAAEDLAIQNNMNSMLAVTKGGADNPAVVKLMQSCGFHVVGRADPLTESGHIRWEKLLRDDSRQERPEL